MSPLNLWLESSFNTEKLCPVVCLMIASSPLIPISLYGTPNICILSALYLSSEITYLFPPVFSMFLFHSEVFFPHLIFQDTDSEFNGDYFLF